MILAGQLLLDSSSGDCRLSPGFVRFDNGYVAEVVEGELPKSADFGGQSWLISPGFIDAHLHLPQFDMIGAHGLPLLQWLSEYTFPAEKRWEDVDFARSMCRRVFQQCMSHGTTAMCAYATVHYDSAIAAIELATSLGLRGAIGQVLMDRGAPDYLCREANRLIDQTVKMIDRFPPTMRMSTAITPRFAVSCTRDLLTAAGKLSRERGPFVQTHLAETQEECEVVRRLFDEQEYVDVYNDSGLIGKRSVFGHGIHLNDRDLQILSGKEATIAHCPSANSFLRSGTMDRVKLARNQVKFAIGSDLGAGYERSMVRVGRSMIEAASTLHDEFPTASQAWHAITAGNADVLGFADAGRIQAGFPADLVAIEPDIPWLDTKVSPLSMLMFAWDDRWIKQVWVQGRPRLPG